MPLNNGWAYRSQVGPESAGVPLLAHLAHAYQHSGRETWAARLARGEVTLDGRHATGGEELRAGQAVVWQRPPWDEPEVPLSFDVVHEDAALLAVNKPAGLPTMPAGGYLEHTLWAVVRARYPCASPVHRLGRFTSGLVLFARHAEAASALSRAWRDRQVEKWYRALGTGHPAWSMTEITVPVGLVPHPRLGRVFAAAPGGKPAHSHVESRGARGPDTLFDVRITTGRPHQIRIHLAAAGHPLAGDPLYGVGGAPRSGDPALPGDGGYWLHAHRLTVAHPSDGQPIRFEAAPPPALI